MQVFLLRHGIAADAGLPGTGDAGRPLTELGITRMQQIARALQRLEVRPDLLLSSPLLRAQQTAEIIGRVLKREVLIDNRLSPGFDQPLLAELLREQPRLTSVLLVGHEPDQSELIRDLTGGATVVKKGGLALLEVDDETYQRGTLLWLMPPRVLRPLGS